MKKIILVFISLSFISSLSLGKEVKTVIDSKERIKADADAWRHLTNCILEKEGTYGSLAILVDCVSESVKQRKQIEPSLRKSNDKI